MNGLLEECKKSPPDGVIVVSMCLNTSWPTINQFVAKRRATFPRSSSARWAPRSPATSRERAASRRRFMAATQDLSWLAEAVHLLRTIWDMKNTRLCIINGDKTEDQRLDVIGTTLHHIPLNRWTEELAKPERPTR